MSEADIGLIGLAVMGQNLILNMNDHGFVVAAFNRTVSKVDDFMAGPAKGTNVIPAHDLKEFISKLKRPRKVMLMVRAGDAVDSFIEKLLPYLEKGDIIIDGGNSHFTDSNRRTHELAEKGILFVGTGISGGEEGARHGPSIMPGGNPEAWPHVKEILQSIAAKADNGEPCCDWVGKDGAGHYVKMVHNGIEYGDIQIICEAYQLLNQGLGFTADELSETFGKWNKEELDSYLIEIAGHVFAHVDEDGKPLIDKILDVAGQKGTGKWACESSLEMGVPLTLISEAVYARCLSAIKDQRVAASKVLKGPTTKFSGDRTKFINSLKNALYASKITSYAQGFMLMKEASEEYTWDINFGSVALMWRNGCIIRSKFLRNIKEAFDKKPDLDSLLLDPFFQKAVEKGQDGWREVVMEGVRLGIPTPCLSTALAFFDGYRTARLPANLIQGLRDYFGAHTYERVDQPRGKFFHTNWTGTGGKVSASSYTV